MQVKGADNIVAGYLRVMMLSELGEHALLQFPAAELNILEVHSGSTHYDAGNNTISINSTSLESHSAEEQCATLCHETFHYFHAMHNREQYRYRLTLSGTRGFPNREEQLTITGSCEGDNDGWNHKLFNENAVLRGFELPERTSHEAFGHASSSTDSKSAENTNVVLDFSTPAKKKPPARFLKR